MDLISSYDHLINTPTIISANLNSRLPIPLTNNIINKASPSSDLHHKKQEYMFGYLLPKRTSAKLIVFRPH